MRWAAATPPPAQGGAPPAPRPRSAAAWTHRPLPALPSAGPPRPPADGAPAPPPGRPRGRSRRLSGLGPARGGGAPIPVPVHPRPHPYSHPYSHPHSHPRPLRRAPRARCPARGDPPRRCLHPPSRGSAPLRSKAQPSLPAAPPVPAGLGAEKSPCPFLPYLRAGLSRAPNGRLRSQLPRHYRIFRPGSGPGEGEPPVQRSRLSCWGERGNDGGVPLVNPPGAQETLLRCCRTPGGGGQRLGPRRHVSNFGETRSDSPPPAPFPLGPAFYPGERNPDLSGTTRRAKQTRNRRRKHWKGGREIIQECFR
ncbi:skin secretory protein xP2-like [Poecile atricapillus]|uniref:skin secretory protein xP2-like n=1 Tax=Poecile atricapillus TaxID=48891 RepID=UPI002738FA2A|nr:skin secretory protein xP2-like [Poecile atricapillus]